MNRRRFLLISAAAPFAGRAAADVSTWQSAALGGVLRADIRGPRGLSAAVNAAIAACIEEVEAAASLFRPESSLCRLNATGRLDHPPPTLRDLLALAGRIHAATEGAFDPTVQPLWRALAEGRDPGPSRALTGWHHVRMAGRITLAPGQALTLNGLAQGYAAERVRRVLAGAGLETALVDMGEFAAIGGPFTLAVEDPAFGPVATRRLTGGAIATSSPGAMMIGASAHILGPRGQPPLWSTVSVEARDAAIADGLSTAFCLMDADAIRRAATRLAGVTRITLVDAGGDVASILPG